MADAPDLSIIICTYNRYDTLMTAIRSIERQIVGSGSIELIVVDNSTDVASQDRFKADLAVKCPLHYAVEPIAGLSRARNIGTALATAPLVAFLDDDAIAEPDWAASIVTAFAVSTDIAVVGGPVRPIWPNERPQWLHKDLEGFLTILDLGQDARPLAAREWLAGTNIAYRKQVLVEAGGFNELVGRIGDVLLSNEEVAISNKIRDAGKLLYYDPAIVVHHLVHRDRLSQTWLRRRVFWQVVSEILSDVRPFPLSPVSEIETILSYFESIPRRNRGIGGLFAEMTEATVFEKQSSAIASLVRLLATDGRDLEQLLGLAE